MIINTYGVTVHVGIRFIMNLAATSAFDFPISALLEEKNNERIFRTFPFT